MWSKEDQQRHQETTTPFPKTGEKTITQLKEGSKTNLLLIQSQREGNFEHFRNFNFFFHPSFECVHTTKKCLLSGINQTEV